MKKEYPKQACPECGVEISTHRLSWTNHMKKHERDKSPEQTASQSVTQVAAKVEAKPKAPAKTAPSQIGDPVERELYERALQAQERFLKAPSSFASQSMCDEHMELRKLYAPDTIDKRDPMTGKLLEKAPQHAYIGDRKARDMDVNRGYVPVFDDTGRHVTTPGGNYMYKMDVRLFDAKQEAYAAESREILQQAEKTASTRSTIGANDAEIPEPSTEMVTMDEATTMRGEGNVNVS